MVEAVHFQRSRSVGFNNYELSFALSIKYIMWLSIGGSISESVCFYTATETTDVALPTQQTTMSLRRLSMRKQAFECFLGFLNSVACLLVRSVL